jgi:hypothetical protein
MRLPARRYLEMGASRFDRRHGPRQERLLLDALLI